jgi:hypothetical protein
MQHLEGSGTPVLYIGRRVLKGLGRWLFLFPSMRQSGSLKEVLVLWTDSLTP